MGTGCWILFLLWKASPVDDRIAWPANGMQTSANVAKVLHVLVPSCPVCVSYLTKLQYSAAVWPVNMLDCKLDA